MLKTISTRLVALVIFQFFYPPCFDGRSVKKYQIVNRSDQDAVGIDVTADVDADIDADVKIDAKFNIDVNTNERLDGPSAV